MATWLQTIADRPARRVVGLMSGTSADGIDAVLAELTGCGPATGFEILAFEARELPADIRARLLALFEPGASVDELCEMDVVLGEAFADAALGVIAAAGLSPAAVDLIGSHGQTVRHFPLRRPPSTLQIGEPAVIAQRTGITTVADFRPADMAVGGQGAPLVPLVDHLLFGHSGQSRLLLNIGGIANITVLPAGAAPEGVRAFDLGPGNMLIDGAVAHATGGRERFDEGGCMAARGRVDRPLLERLLAHEFFQRPPPKSTGREEFGTPFLASLLQEAGVHPVDLVATLTAFTASSIVEGIERFVLPQVEAGEMWVSGGGVHNLQLMAALRDGLPSFRVGSLAELGVSPDAREALTFAVLANETLAGRAGNLPSATGARREAVLGKIVAGTVG